MCDCVCHENEKWDYRIVMGTQHEGISLREVLYDDKGKIVGWNPKPLGPTFSSVADVKSTSCPR
jgi:hypothetical protein